MADQRAGGIAWTDETWNPVRGCSRISPGCVNCYAETIAARFSGPGQAYEGLAHRVGGEARWTGKVVLVPEHLTDPLRWRRARKVFVDSMSDLFHEALTNEQIAAVFGVMAAATHHTFQVLTKRASRAREWFEWATKRGADGLRAFPEDDEAWRIRQCMHVEARRAGVDMNSDERQNHGGPWPLPNVWLGVSVEDQRTADERLLELLRTPAAVRWASYEPALGPINFNSIADEAEAPRYRFNALLRGIKDPSGHPFGHHGHTSRIDWIVVGGESGPGARPFDIAWAHSTVERCRVAGVPVFVKQLGAQPLYYPHYGGKGGCHALLSLHDRKGGDLSEWPEDLRVQEFPTVPA